MIDPLAEIVAVLQPSAPRSKLVSAAGQWAVHRAEAGGPFYCVVIEGTCRLAVNAEEPLVLAKGDFVLIPAAFDFTVSSLDPPKDGRGLSHVRLPDGEVRHGEPGGPPDARMLVGYCEFASPDSGLLVSLLPGLVHVRDEPRFTLLVGLVREESRESRPAREFILSRLLEVLLLEALRSKGSAKASPGLLRGLADEHLAAALRRMHEQPARAWTVAELAKEAALSRSSFFERFKRTVGLAPMEYILGWRMAVAKNLLHRSGVTVAEVAERVGYGSSSTFSVAFCRHVGRPPSHYAREQFELRRAHEVQLESSEMSVG
ncbi:MAG TPA: AraC family transcriptional regulator [Spirochaetia bacterium]|nr:AraC family transcriptional regulator [Spirochaetia bacterium]